MTLAHQPHAYPALVMVGAIILAALCVALPPEWVLLGSVGLALAGLSVWEPVVGLGLAVLIAPLKAYVALAVPGVPAEIGQIFFACALVGWAGRRALTHDMTWRTSNVLGQPAMLGLLTVWLSALALSLLPAQDMGETLGEIFKWVQVALTVLVVADEARRESPGRGWRLGVLAGLVVLAGATHGALGVWQHALRGTGPEPFALPGGLYRAYGTFEQPNPFGGYLGLIWPVAAGLAWGLLNPLPRTRWRWLMAGGCLLAAGLALGGLYASYSRGAWLGAAGAGAVLVALSPRRWWLGMTLVSALALVGGMAWQAGWLPASVAGRLANFTELFTLPDVRTVRLTADNFALVERRAHWQAGEAMAAANLWWGVGAGNFNAAYNTYRLEAWPTPLGHAHMMYLNVWAETGLVGLFAYITLWLGVIGLTWRVIMRHHGAWRGLAVGWLAAWAHLSAHHLVDSLYVNNIHLLIGAGLALMNALAQPNASS